MVNIENLRIELGVRPLTVAEAAGLVAAVRGGKAIGLRAFRAEGRSYTRLGDYVMHHNTVSRSVTSLFDGEGGDIKRSQSNGPVERSARSRKKKPRTPLVLIDPAPLTRQSISAMFARALPEYLIITASHGDELLAAAEAATHSPTLVVINAKGAAVTDPWVQATLEGARSALGEVPVVLLSDRNDVDDAINALSFGVRGYINPSVEPQLGFAALKLVSAGGIFIPAHAIRAAASKADNPSSCTRQHAMTVFDLTPRELSVVDLLREGKPNKRIAAELQMQESTVKVHVRNIIKKLHVSNRTHAATVANRLFDQQSLGLSRTAFANRGAGLFSAHTKPPDG